MKQTLNKHPEFIEAVAVREKLQTALEQERKAETELFERLNRICIAPAQVDAVEDALAAANGQPAPAGADALHRALAESRSRQQVYLAGLERQEQKLSDLAARLSIAYCREHTAKHVAIAARIKQALEDLRRALTDEQTLRETIKDSGYRDVLPGLHRFDLSPDSDMANAIREIGHYLMLNGGKLSPTKQVAGVALCDFALFGAVGIAGQPLTVTEQTAELLRHHGVFDPSTAAVKATRLQQLERVAH